MTEVLSRIRSIALAIERVITVSAVFLGSLALAGAVAVGFYQVLARFILFQPASWSEPLIQGLLIWMTYLALAGAMRSGTLIAVDLLLNVSVGRARAAVRAFGLLATLALLGVLLFFGTILVYRVRFQTFAGLNIPASYVYAALPVGSVVSIIALLGHALDATSKPADPTDNAI